jgi:predicted HicB family RNase H-like nuclease
MMTYKGYTGVVKFDDEANVFFGEVVDLRDVITFEGRTVEELRQAFHDSVEDYLEFCASRGEKPEKPYSGKFLVRVPPRIHKRLAIKAAGRGVSLNTLVSQALAGVVREERPPAGARIAAKATRAPRRKKPATKAAKSRTGVVVKGGAAGKGGVAGGAGVGGAVGGRMAARLRDRKKSGTKREPRRPRP